MLAIELLSDWPVVRWRDRRLLVGVSGGADSVALLLALHELAAPGQLVVAHLNHGWRGQESDGDQAFVVKLCAQLGRLCIASLLQDRDKKAASHVDDNMSRGVAMLATAQGDGALGQVGEVNEGTERTEEYARRARYEFFKASAYQVGASYVVTAHTADDRVETLLHNLFRGTGPAGAASLVAFRSLDEDLVLARPLLRKRRAEIESFLAARGQDFRQDSSNFQTHYRRNFLRHRVLPMIEQEYPSAADSLLNFSELAEDLVMDVERLANQWLADVQHKLSSGTPALRAVQVRWPAADYFLAPLALVQSTPWSVVQAALRQVWNQRQWSLGQMSRVHWQAVRELCLQSSGVVNLPGNLRAEAAASYLAIGISVSKAFSATRLC